MESEDRLPPNEGEEDDETESQEAPHTGYTFYVNQSSSKPSKDPFLGLRIILLPLPSAIWLGILWLFGAAIGFVWHTFHSVIYSSIRADLLTGFFVLFFMGLGFLIYVIKGDSFPGRWGLAINPLGRVMKTGAIPGQWGMSWNALVPAILLLAPSFLLLYLFIIGK